jgi:hypothetical protein
MGAQMNRVEIKLLERGDFSRRRALNSPLKQGASETVQYYVDFTPWGASDTYPVSLPVLKVLNQDNSDVTHDGLVLTAVVADGGTNYEVGDILTITDTGSSGDATLTVLTVDSGVILTAAITTAGFDYTAGVKATTGHTEDATFTITVSSSDQLVDRNSISVVGDVEVQFTLSNFVAGDRYRVFIKGTINSLVGECWSYIDGEL